MSGHGDSRQMREVVLGDGYLAPLLICYSPLLRHLPPNERVPTVTVAVTVLVLVSITDTLPETEFAT